LIYGVRYIYFTMIHIYQKPDSVLLIKLEDVQIRTEPVDLDELG